MQVYISKEDQIKGGEILGALSENIQINIGDDRVFHQSNEILLDGKDFIIDGLKFTLPEMDRIEISLNAPEPNSFLLCLNQVPWLLFSKNHEPESIPSLVKHLVIRGDVVLESLLEKCQQIETLIISNNSMCDNLTGELSKLKRVELIKCNSLTNISVLSHLTGLTKLDLRWCESLADFSVLWSLTGLTELNLEGCELLKDINGLSNLTGLTVLELNWCQSIIDLGVLSSLTGLTQLQLSGFELLTDIREISNLKGLTQLYLSWFESLTDISALSSLTGLTVIPLPVKHQVLEK